MSKEDNQPKEELLDKILNDLHLLVFPCKQNTKEPALKGWQQKASSDPQQVAEWFNLINYNYGVICGTEREGKFLAIMDVDNKNGKDGSASWEKLTEGIDPNKLDTFTVRTPNNGHHYYFYTDMLLPNTKDFVEGVELRSKGLYAIGPLSQINGVPYSIENDKPILDLPKELYPLVRKNQKALCVSNRIVGRNTILEGDRNNAIFKLAVGMKKNGTSLEAALDMVRIYNTSMCIPPLDDTEVEKTVRSAYGYDNEGFAHRILSPSDGNDFMSAKGYFIACLGTENYVWEVLKDNKVERYQQIPFKNFKNKYPHLDVEVGRKENGQPILQNLGEWWIKNTSCRYDFAFFNPSKGTTYYEDQNFIRNLWEGFCYEPVHHEGRADSFLGHIKENVCANNENLYVYFLDWLASIIQNPADKTGKAITVVLQGLHGTGKGFLCKMIGKLFGKAYGYINVDKYALEQFNGQLENKLFVFFDEVIWSHDKKKANYVKSLITEETFEINKKYINSYASNNYMRFILATNNFYEGAFVEREDERRFFILDMVPNHRCDKAYFDKIENDLNEGGFEELMHLLVSRDITKRNFEKIPVTAAKRGTVIENLDSLDSWICSKALDGGFGIKVKFPSDEFFRRFGKDRALARELWELYQEEAKGQKRCSSFIGFMMALTKKLPCLKKGKIHDTNGNVYELPPIEEVIADIKETIGVDLSDDLKRC
jgi:hypothetical protein